MNDGVVAERTAADQAALIEALSAIVGRDAVETSFAEREFYSLDFSEEGGAIAMAVVKPTTAEQVAAIVRAATRARVAVNARGGGMSYTKGHVPVRPETIILDATGLNRVLEVN